MKNLLKKITIILKAGQATSAGSVSFVLGSWRINTANFIKEYNERTRDQLGTVLPAKVSVYDDRTFSFILKTPLTSSLLLKSANLEKAKFGSAKSVIAFINKEELTKIAELKLPDLNTKDIKKAEKIIEGTASNMGLDIFYFNEFYHE